MLTLKYNCPINVDVNAVDKRGVIQLMREDFSDSHSNRIMPCLVIEVGTCALFPGWIGNE